jgi:hypothetical protein
MSTANELATKALRRLGVVDATEDPAAADVLFCTDMLASMIAEWDVFGMAGEVQPLDARFEKGLIAMLAVSVAETFNKEPGPILMRDAEAGEESLMSAFVPVRSQQIDNALLRMSGGPFNGGCRALPAPGVPEWTAGTDYRMGALVYSGSYIYRATQAGTSSTAPTGTESAITDGSVIWQFDRVYGG